MSEKGKSGLYVLGASRWPFPISCCCQEWDVLAAGLCVNVEVLTLLDFDDMSPIRCFSLYRRAITIALVRLLQHSAMLD